MVEQLLDYEVARKMRDDLSAYARDHINLSSNAEMVFGNLYQKILEDGTPESIADRMAAISIDVASADLKYFPEDMPAEEKIDKVRERARKNLDLYVSNTFRANTPTNLNMGRWVAKYNDEGELTHYTQPNQLGSACFVLPVEDTFGDSVEDLKDGILEAWVTQQLVHKGGGGTGFPFQRLRPKGSIIGYNPVVDGMESTNWNGGRGVSSGYESFLNYFFNPATDAVKQGNSRRGANMGIQRVDHMDFLDHLFAKAGRDKFRQEYRMKNFNLSLAVTDEFMDAAKNGHTYTLFNPLRAKPRSKKILEKQGVKSPEIVRRADLATRSQFEKILEKNEASPFTPLTTPSMYIDNDDTTVINAYTGDSIGVVVDDIVRIDASKVLDLFAKNSHSNGEPGMVFLDRMNEYNPNLDDYSIEATNPCGEQPLPPYGACNLGSINAGIFTNYRVFDSQESIDLEERLIADSFTKVENRTDGRVGVIWFDWEKYRATIHDGVHFLDNVIDRSDFPTDKIGQAVDSTRNIGLGLMGVYDAMVLMKRRYGSEESLEFADALARVLHEESLKASQNLAKERGEFPLYPTSFHNPDSRLHSWITSNPTTIPDKFRGEQLLSDLVDRKKVMTYGGGIVRNSCITTQAPTGTIRRATGHKLEKLAMDNLAVSSGIEPIYSLIEKSYILNTQIEDWSSATVQLLHREGLDLLTTLDAIKQNRGSVFIYKHTPAEVVEVLRKIPEDVRNVLVTASGGENSNYEITAEQHIQMMATFQKYCDSSISKTINLPGSASVGDMRDAWITLHESGVKGGTIYRDNSREFQILNISMKEESSASPVSKRRPLLQRSITFEHPYLSSRSNENEGGDLDFHPDRVFTTIAFNPINGGITGIFQNIPEVDPERLSNIIELNIDKSRALKQGRSLDVVIADLEKISQKGTRRGIIVDKAVMPERSTEGKRYEISGSTTGEARLHSLYVMRFLTEGGTNFDEVSMNEKLDKYFSGAITLKTILNTRGKVTLEESNNGRPSILKNGKIVKLPDEISGIDCPECM